MGSLVSSLLLWGVLAPASPSADAAQSPAPTVRPEHREELDVLPDDQLDVEEAKRLFAAGKQAAEHGRWDEAIRYFAEAYRHSGSPGQLYSMGRGHRELYFNQGRDPVQLRLALLRFEQYLERSPQGRNRANTKKYIEELRSYATVLEGFDQPELITRLMVHGPVDGATVSIDGGPPSAAPVTFDVEPGNHRVQMSAPGYHEADRRVEVPEGATVPLEIVLEERAAELRVTGPAGAELYVDGQRTGRLPLQTPVVLEAGPHQVAVAQRGHTPFVREIELTRGEARTLEVDLPITFQRKLSFVAMGLGAGSSVAAITLGGLALRSQTQAQQVEQERLTVGVSEARFAQGQAAWQQRDTRRVAALSTGVVGVVLIGAGLVAYFTDDPRLADRLYRPDRAPGGNAAVAVVPFAGTGLAGTAVVGRF